MSDEALKARLAVELGEQTQGTLMVMPAGTHEINATRAGKSVTAMVHVERAAAAALQEQLQAVNSRGPQRAFFDFCHKDEEASGWPLRFFWAEQPAPGVYAQVEWSAKGAEAIKGKSY